MNYSETDVSPPRRRVARKVNLAPNQHNSKDNSAELRKNGVEAIQRQTRQRRELQENRKEFGAVVNKMNGSIDIMSDVIDNSLEINEKIRERNGLLVEKSVKKTLSEVVTEPNVCCLENEFELMETTILIIHKNHYDYKNKYDTKDILQQVHELSMLTGKKAAYLLNTQPTDSQNESTYQSFLNSKDQLHNLVGNDVTLTKALDEIVKGLDEHLAKESDPATKEREENVALKTATSAN